MLRTRGRSWFVVRMAVATVAFGFLVETSDLFLKVTGMSLGGWVPSPAGQMIGDVAELALIVLGGAMMVLSVVRFCRTARDVDSMVTVAGGSGWVGVVLTALLLLGAVLFGYLLYTVSSPDVRAATAAIGLGGGLGTE